MRIYEVLHWNDKSHRSDTHLDPFNDLTKLSGAFTKDGRVKHFWNFQGSEGQPYGPAPPGAETEVIASGTVEPTTASWEAEPVEKEPPVGLHRLVPFRQY